MHRKPSTWLSALHIVVRAPGAPQAQHGTPPPCPWPRTLCQPPRAVSSLPQQHCSRAGPQLPTALYCHGACQAGPTTHPCPSLSLSPSPSPGRCLMPRTVLPSVTLTRHEPDPSTWLDLRPTWSTWPCLVIWPLVWIHLPYSGHPAALLAWLDWLLGPWSSGSSWSLLLPGNQPLSKLSVIMIVKH